LNKRLCLASLVPLCLLLMSSAVSQSTAASLAGGPGQTQSSPQAFSQSVKGHVSVSGELKKLGTTYIPLNSQSQGPNPANAAGNTTRVPPTRVKPTGITSALSASVPVVSADDIIESPGGASVANGVNAFDNYKVNGVDYEPPDQGLCVGNGYVIDVVNTVLRVYTTSFTSLSSDISPNSIDGLALSAFTSDPRCLFDQASGHWFITQLLINLNGLGQGFEYIAVSATSVPWGSWNVYALNVTDSFPATPAHSGQTSDPGCPCFGDQPLLGASRDALVVSTNEFSIFGPTFNGAQIYLVDKEGLALGRDLVPFVHLNTLGVPTPDGECVSSGGVFCWYSVNPAGSPAPTQYDNSNSGTEYALSSLDFQGKGDSRLAAWAFTNLGTLQSKSPDVSFSISVAGGLEPYLDPVGPSGNAFLAPQKPGPIPLGDTVYSNRPHAPTYGCLGKCPEGVIQSNGDGMFDDVVYAQGALWGAIDTEVREEPGSSTVFAGAAYWVVNAVDSSFALASQGYVAAKGEDIVFPSIGVGPDGDGVIAFSLTGADYYPSGAYGLITKSSGGLVGRMMFVADRGMSPYDATTEYQCISGTCGPSSGLTYTPRYGDYSWAVWSGGRVYFATEYVQHKNCGLAQYKVDPTCGDTRGPDANWGTSLNSLSA
jgi:hypothetical protein